MENKENPEIKSKRTFCSFGGETKRLRFLLNSLIISAVFGASFAFLMPALSLKHPTGYLADVQPPMIQQILYSIELGAFCGPIILLSSGLTSLYLALFYLRFLGIGSVLSAASPGFGQMTLALAAVIVMISMIILAYGNIAKRIRSILGSNSGVHSWCATVLGLSLIPGLGTAAYLFLLLTPQRSNLSKKRQILRFGLGVVAFFAGAFFTLVIISNLFKHDLIQHDLDKITKNPSGFKRINLANKKLTSFPPEILQMKDLISCNISSNLFSELPSGIGNLVHLKNLYVSGNHLSFLPSDFGNLVELKDLSLSRNQFQGIPDQIFECKRLEQLDLCFNEMSELSPRIAELKKLKVLNLYNNKLKVLPREIGELENLVLLQIDNNELSALPPEIGKLTKLESLDVNGNKLSRFPEEISHLTNLKYLNCYKNHLSAEEINKVKLLLPHTKVSGLGGKIDQNTET